MNTLRFLATASLVAVLVAGALAACRPSSNDVSSPPGPSSQAMLDDDGEARRILPTDHTIDWMRRHAVIARANPTECASCHVEQDCTSCHNEQLARPYAVHPPNYVTIHAVDARIDPAPCMDCHQVESFCSTCHMQARVSPRPDFTPPPRFEFHPPGWLEATHPNNHGVMARRNINDCASCHSENDCVTCHTGINPHPPQFRMECRRWLEANPQPCARCHGDVGALQTMCL